MILSIIVPLYNCKNFIETCLSSIVNQELSPDKYEIIVVNDGSTDGSEIIVFQNFIEHFRNIRLYNQQNKGISAARNRGLQDARGDFIFADAIIPNFRNVIDFAKTAHTQIPNIRLAGWDICLNESNNPVLIEVNTSWPGIFYEQLCSGPIFGKRTDEVIDFCRTTRENTKCYRFHLGLDL